MVYGLLLLTWTFLTVKGYCGKKVSTFVNSQDDVMFFNLIRMLFCAGIGWAVMQADAVFFPPITWGMMGICILAGLSNVVFLIGWMMAIQKNPMVTIDIMITFGSMLPPALCALLFHELIPGRKLLGYGLLLLAAGILSGYKGSASRRPGLSGIALALLAAAGDGMISFTQQLYKRFYSGVRLLEGKETNPVTYPISGYQFYTYTVAALILLLAYAFCSRGKGMGKQRFASLKKPLPHIFVLAVCFFAANYLQTLITGKYGIPAQVLYPVIRGGCLITVTGTAMIFFGEKPTVWSILGSLTALLGIIVINIM